jgi:hypothetical protein
MEMRDIARRRFPIDEGYAQSLVRKWRPLLEGIDNEYKKVVTAVLLENQSNHLKTLTEETRSTNVGEFIKYIFPIIRRVWPNLIANEIVAVQPMTAPVGAIFYYELKYATTKGATTAGKEMIKNLDVYYSSEQVKGEIIGTGDGSTTHFTHTANFVPLKKNTVVVTAGTVVGTDDGAGNIVGTGITGTVDYETGAIDVTFSTAPDAGVPIVLDYRYDMEINKEIPQLMIDIAIAEVRAETRKLKAVWSPEAADDLRAFHGIDAEVEIVAGLASEIALEIDREIIGILRENANENVDTWSKTIPSGVSEVDHYRSILTPITRVSNLIHKKTLRGPANWIITGPEVATILSQLATHGFYRPIFAPATSEVTAPPENVGIPGYGIYKAGVLANRWTVYVDPYFPDGEILIGLKGPSFLDSGFVYAPYVPLQMTPTFLDPSDFSYKKGMRTRYAKKLVRPEFYGKVIVTP